MVRLQHSDVVTKTKIIQVALGQKKADLYIRNCKLVNVFTGEIIDKQNIAVTGKYISYTGPSEKMVTDSTEVFEAAEAYCIPGYIDPHAHVDFWANPLSLTPYLLKSGTTSVMADPHDIVGAVGPKGLDLLIEMTRNLPLKFFFSLPVSSPPFPEFEGEDIIPKSVMRYYLQKQAILSLSEITPWIRLISQDKDLIEKLVLGERMEKRIEGHTPGASFDKLNALVGAGLTSCHEALNADEARARLRLGLSVMLRHGSVREDLDALISLVTEEPKVDTRKIMFTPDWKKPSDIIKEGYMDNMVCSAIQMGVTPVEAIQMATLNPATYLKLDRWYGSIAPGRRADILLVDDIRRPSPRTVIADGQVVVRDGEIFFEQPPLTPYAKKIPWLAHRLIPNSIESTDFYVKTSVHTAYANVPAISVVNKTITERVDLNLPVKKRQIHLPADKDVLKISLFNKENSGFVTAFITGFGAKLGGLATSMSHERHMPLVVGNREKDMALALHRLREIGGGVVLVHNGEVREEISLVIGGIMSDGPLEELSTQMQSMNQTIINMGSNLEDPLFTLGFLSFSALPWIRITPSGLLDVKSRKIIW